MLCFFLTFFIFFPLTYTGCNVCCQKCIELFCSKLQNAYIQSKINLWLLYLMQSNLLWKKCLFFLSLNFMQRQFVSTSLCTFHWSQLIHSRLLILKPPYTTKKHISTSFWLAKRPACYKDQLAIKTSLLWRNYIIIIKTVFYEETYLTTVNLP